MAASGDSSGVAHGEMIESSRWVTQFAPLVTRGGLILDYACGSGRHARWLASHGWRVEAIDRDAEVLGALDGVAGIATRCVELEGPDWPLAGRGFDAVVVTNYLYRPRFDALLACLKPGAVLIYETFMLGNERFGRPANPDFLLRPGELLARVADGFTVVAFEQGIVHSPRDAVVQRICAVKDKNALVELPAM